MIIEFKFSMIENVGMNIVAIEFLDCNLGRKRAYGYFSYCFYSRRRAGKMHWTAMWTKMDVFSFSFFHFFHSTLSIIFCCILISCLFSLLHYLFLVYFSSKSLNSRSSRVVSAYAIASCHLRTLFS